MTRDGTHYYGDDCPGGHITMDDPEIVNDWGIRNFGKSYSEIMADLTDVDELRAEVERLHKAYETTAHEVEQTLGRALSYPGYPDEDSETVCVGDHVPETLASEAAMKLVSYQEALERIGWMYPAVRYGPRKGWDARTARAALDGDT